jgi:hypothetical protein
MSVEELQTAMLRTVRAMTPAVAHGRIEFE